MHGIHPLLPLRNQFGALRGDAVLLLAGLGWLIGTRSALQRVISGFRLIEDVAVCVFPGAQEKERQRRSQGPELGIARNLGLWLPAKELRGDEKGEHRPDGEGQNLNQELPDGKRLVEGALERGNKIGGGQEEPEVLDGLGQIGKGERGAGKENQRQPDDLVEDLSFLHRVGNAGDNEAERSEGNRADGNQDSERKKIAKAGNMKNEAGEKKLEGNGRKGEHVVCQETGGQHICGGDGGDVEAAQNPLLAEHHQGGAESPKTTHHVEGDNRAEEIADGAGIAAGENAGIEKKHAEGENHAEEKNILLRRAS